MGWITKCHHRMQLLILLQSKQLRKLLPVARAYDTASDPMIPRCQRHIRNRQPGVRIAVRVDFQILHHADKQHRLFSSLRLSLFLRKICRPLRLCKNLLHLLGRFHNDIAQRLFIRRAGRVPRRRQDLCQNFLRNGLLAKSPVSSSFF